MKFREPLPIKKRWSVLIRCLMYSAPVLLLVVALLVKIYSLKRNEKSQRALAMCTQLEMAINNFYEDNGTMPLDVNEDVTMDLNSREGIELLELLLNKEASDHPISAKGRKYLDLREGRHNKDGIIYNEAGNRVLGLYDPWGGSFKIRIDGDMDGVIEVQLKAEELAKRLNRIATVWSDGEDADDPEDDVVTW